MCPNGGKSQIIMEMETTPQIQIQIQKSNLSFSSSSLFQILAAIFGSYLCVAGGMVLGYSSSAIESLQNDPEFNQDLTTDDISWIGSFGPIGSIFGSLATILIVKYMGVRGTMLYVAVPAFIYSWSSIALSGSIPTILLGRFIGGAGLGLAMTCAPMYVVSIVDSYNRGRLGVLPQFMMLFGIFISYSVGALCDWKMHALACLVITAPSFQFLYYAPEPPYWLYCNNRQGEALVVLEKLYGKVAALVEFDRYMTLKPATSPPMSSTDSFKNSYWFRIENIKPILLSFGLMSFQQYIGINGVLFYSVTIFKNSAGTTSSWGPHAPSIILAFVQCATALCTSPLIERWGRRPLLGISAVLTGLGSFGLGAYFYLINFGTESYEHLFWIPLVTLVIYSIGFAIGFGPVSWLYISEILPAELRPTFQPIIIAYTWSCTFIVTKSFLYIVNYINLFGIFWMYGTISLLALVFALSVLPETKGKSLDEIRELFSPKGIKQIFVR